MSRSSRLNVRTGKSTGASAREGVGRGAEGAGAEGAGAEEDVLREVGRA